MDNSKDTPNSYIDLVTPMQRISGVLVDSLIPSRGIRCFVGAEENDGKFRLALPETAIGEMPSTCSPGWVSKDPKDDGISQPQDLTRAFGSESVIHGQS
jgi:hypothetical protein